MFQPGEEGFDGAGHMIAEGVLEAAGRPVEAAYGIHVFSSMLPKGVVESRPGALLAASTALSVRVVGIGGHGSQPHAVLDPIPAACEMVTALQTMVTRRFDVFDPVVVTVGSFHAGTQRNIIPDVATFEATIRTFFVDDRGACIRTRDPALRGHRRSARADCRGSLCRREPGNHQRRDGVPIRRRYRSGALR
jgi:amidohydrolase